MDELLRRVLDRAHARPGQVAIIESRRTITYGELARQIEAVQVQLRLHGLETGDAALFAVRPGIASIVLLSGLMLAGATVVGVDPGVDQRILAERLRLVKPRWAVAESLVYAAAAAGPLRWLLARRGLQFPPLRTLAERLVRVGRRWPGVPPAIAFSRLIGAPPAACEPFGPLRAERPVLVLFTSGTTAAPKAVEHTARSLSACCSIVSDLLALEEHDVVYSNQSHMLLAGLIAGATCVIPGARLDPQHFVRAIERRGVTRTYAVPFEIIEVVRLLERRRARLPADLKTIVLGGATIGRALLERLRAVSHGATDVWCAYGMSEMFPVALIEAREKLAFDGSGDLVGAPVSGTSVSIGPDDELRVRGPHLFARYLGEPPAEWHATGDLARLDAARRIVLLGRKKEMIIRGRHKIYPSLYEPQIASIPGVERCALVGLPTADPANERVALAIEPGPAEDAGRLHARVVKALGDGTCAIDAFAQPDVIVVGPIPHGGRSFKLDRSALAQAILAQLEDHES